MQLCPRPRHPRAAALLLGALVVPLAACGSSGSGSASSTPTVVVTYSILGDIVQQLVGDAATVRVVIPNGQDPHEYEPSAKDVEAIQHARFVVDNGLDLEEGLAAVLEQAQSDGVTVFAATDHIRVRTLGPNDPVEHADASGGESGAQDPHFWTDPMTVLELAPALSAELSSTLGVPLDSELTAFESELRDLDGQVRTIMSAVPAGTCELVTGHDSLGYFSQRYGCTLVGAVVPSLSSSAETSAQELAQLHDLAASHGVRAVFTEVGTPRQVAQQVADEVGVPLIELPSHNLPDTGGYAAYMVDLATKIADGVTGRPQP